MRKVTEALSASDPAAAPYVKRLCLVCVRKTVSLLGATLLACILQLHYYIFMFKQNSCVQTGCSAPIEKINTNSAILILNTITKNGVKTNTYNVNLLK